MRLIILGALLLTAACQPRGMKASERPYYGGPLSYELLEGHEPNQYSVRLTWSREASPATWILYRSAKNQQPIEIAKLAGQHVSWRDEEVTAGSQYHYMLGFMDGGQFRTHATIEAEIPTDIVLSGAVEAGEIPVANRIFLKGAIDLSTFPSERKIHANHLIAQNAVMEVTSLSRGKEQLTIVAPRATGNLKIVAKGLNGRNGFRKGRNFPDELPPLNGADSPYIHVETFSQSGFSVDIQREPGKGGKWFEELRVPGAVDGRVNPYCVRQSESEFGDCSNFPRILKVN